MSDAWFRIERWLEHNEPEFLHSLNPPALPAVIEVIERNLGAGLPGACRTLYVLHNGQSQGWTFTGNQRLVMLEEGLEHQGVLSELLDAGEFEGQTVEADEGVKPDWWNHRWFPFTHNGAGDHLCLDFDPAPGGQPGQVIGFWHADTDRPLVAVSFEAWLEAIADDLERGALAFDAAYRGFMQG